MAERIIRGEQDIVDLNLSPLLAEDLDSLSSNLRDLIYHHSFDQNELSWGIRVFRSEDDTEIIVTPSQEGWYGNPELNELQVNVYSR